MINRTLIPAAELILPAILRWTTSWFLLTAGDNESGAFNAMTVGWGGIGVMWSKPIAMVVVRPSRYTYEFMEKYDSFTLSVFPEDQRQALQICGTTSGRDSDKIRLAGLTPIPSFAVEAPGFDEAELIIECRKVYADALKPSMFLSPDIMKHYPEGDVHTMYFGEIVAIHGTQAYRVAEAAAGK